MAQEPVSQDLVAQGVDRIITQYRGKPKLQATVEATLQPIQELDDGALMIPPFYDLDTAAGVQLDIDGQLVGQSRILVNGSIVNDPQYRLLIRARIARNGSHATGEDFISQLVLIFGVTVQLTDWMGMAIGYAIGRALSSDEIAVLQGDILPKPMGVMINPREWFDINNFFGMLEDTRPGRAQFADDSGSSPVGGGKLAVDF